VDEDEGAAELVLTSTLLAVVVVVSEAGVEDAGALLLAVAQ
jgi:hypothetical protein